MVRHNYPNCTACHVSPSGGGVLTQYGRELSQAVLSTWGAEEENESKFAWNLVPLPSWLDAMGLLRGVYFYQNTPFIEQGQYIFMQGDLEAAAHLNRFFVDATFGYQNLAGASSFTDHFISRRHYLGYHFTDEITLRGGRFLPTYGILTPDHNIPIKRDLGWDYGFNPETYNLEASWIGSWLNVFATADFGRPDAPSLNTETGAALTGSVSIADHYKVGASYYYGSSKSGTRHTFGPWGILGFTPNFFLLSEFDLQQKSSPTNSSQWGAVNYQKLGYEIVQGLIVYGTQDYSRLDFGDPNSLRYSFGLGAQFFPRPHFEINASWQKLLVHTFGDTFTDYAWVMLNIYI